MFLPISSFLKKTYGIFVEPQNITDREKVINTLSAELDISVASIAGKFNNNSLLWLPIAHQIDEKKKEMIASYKLAGVGFMNETKRYYPEASMAAQLLGFVGKSSSGEDIG